MTTGRGGVTAPDVPLELDPAGVEALDVPLEPEAAEGCLCAGRFLCAADGFWLGGWDAFAVVVLAAAGVVVTGGGLTVVAGGSATGMT